MIDHLTLPISNLERSIKFYEAALAPLDYVKTVQFEFPGEGFSVAGFGVGGKSDFWLSPEKKPSQSLHLAFRAKDRASVRAFYEAALRAGAKDNGAPGPRPHYHPNYYGAFVHDPDGHNIEACCHHPEP